MPPSGPPEASMNALTLKSAARVVHVAWVEAHIGGQAAPPGIRGRTFFHGLCQAVGTSSGT